MKGQTKTPPKGRSGYTAVLSEKCHCNSVIILAIASLILLALACQPLQAQDPGLVRATVRLLRECKVDRDRVAELTAEQAQAEDLCRQRVELAEQRLDLERRARELDRREAEIIIAELRGRLAAWQARSRDQASLIEELSKRRKWWCLWLCSRGIKTREIPEP